MGYADENAGECPVLWKGGKGGVDRRRVVLFSDVAGIGNVRGVEGGVIVFILCGGEMWPFSEKMNNWGNVGGMRRAW